MGLKGLNVGGLGQKFWSPGGTTVRGDQGGQGGGGKWSELGGSPGNGFLARGQKCTAKGGIAFLAGGQKTRGGLGRGTGAQG